MFAAGTIARGIATYLLLFHLGLAVGITAIEPGEALARIALGTGIWTFISLLIAAFVGRWQVGLMSGLRRRTDGVLHGFVAWGLTALSFAYLTTTVFAGLVGDAANIVGQGIQTAAQAADRGQLRRTVVKPPCARRAYRGAHHF